MNSTTIYTLSPGFLFMQLVYKPIHTFLLHPNPLILNETINSNAQHSNSLLFIPREYRSINPLLWATNCDNVSIFNGNLPILNICQVFTYFIYYNEPIFTD